ncbi:unnamed protein product [Symbiodinium sp. CCMP2456]|nr:unnamed protein product [Symbiodinium sp. CCMP2456]
MVQIQEVESNSSSEDSEDSSEAELPAASAAEAPAPSATAVAAAAPETAPSSGVPHPAEPPSAEALRLRATLLSNRAARAAEEARAATSTPSVAKNANPEHPKRRVKSRDKEDRRKTDRKGRSRSKRGKKHGSRDRRRRSHKGRDRRSPKGRDRGRSSPRRDKKDRGKRAESVKDTPAPAPSKPKDAVLRCRVCDRQIRGGASGLDQHQRMAASPSVEGQLAQCSLCLLQCEKVSTRGAQLVCAGCVNVSSMLQYKLGGKVSATLEDKVAFFRRAKSTGSARLEWKTVRALVKEHMIMRKIKQSEVSVGGKYLPMNVHLAAGWSESQVTAKNDFMEDPELGKVWRVPVMEKTVRQIDEEIEEELTTKEQEVTKSRQGKKRKPQEGEQEEPDLDLPCAKAQGKAGDSNKAAKKEEQEETKAARLTFKNNKAKAALAAKAVASLSTLLSSLNSAKGFAAKVWEELPQDLRTSLTEALATALAWKTAATSALQFQENYEQAALKDPAAPVQPLPVLPFTAETFHDYDKAAKAAVKELRRAARDKKDEAAAAADASGKAKAKPKRRVVGKAKAAA